MADESTGKAKGARARANSLSPAERSEIAKRAAAERWTPQLPKATHAGDIKIGEVSLACSVLDDGARVLSLRGINAAFGSTYGGPSKRLVEGGRNLPRILQSKAVMPFISDELMAGLSTPREFKPLHGGRTAFGYDASLLPAMCEVVIDAGKAGHIANENAVRIAEILLRGFARVGIIALVDEATGYQEIRDRNALQKILEQFVRKELAVWAKRFPDEFYEEMYRLRGWEWRGMGANRISACAHYTKDLVYERIASGLLKELESKNPVLDNGRRKGAHHQWLTDEVGVPALARHFGSVVTLQRLSKSWDEFYALMDRFHPKRGDSLHLPFDDNRIDIANLPS